MTIPERIKQAREIIYHQHRVLPCKFNSVPLVKMSLFLLFLEVISEDPRDDALETWEKYLGGALVNE